MPYVLDRIQESYGRAQNMLSLLPFSNSEVCTWFRNTGLIRVSMEYLIHTLSYSDTLHIPLVILYPSVIHSSPETSPTTRLTTGISRNLNYLEQFSITFSNPRTSILNTRIQGISIICNKEIKMVPEPNKCHKIHDQTNALFPYKDFGSLLLGNYLLLFHTYFYWLKCW